LVYSKEIIAELEGKAKQVRRDIIRMLVAAGSGHPGGSLSSADIVTCLYFSKMRHSPKDPKWPDRDRFVLSKGHCAPVLYACLAETGYFPVDELMTLRKINSRLQGHPDMVKTPGVEMSTGSLGQGLAVGNGMALAARLDKKNYRVYVVLGDGEIEEGEVWEAAMASAHYKLDNVCAILDHNGLQIDGPNCCVMDPEPVAEKWKAFGWNVIDINGHSISEILEALDRAEALKGKPTMIVAKTVKGKGVSFMENVVDFHGKAPTAEEGERALKELN